MTKEVIQRHGMQQIAEKKHTTSANSYYCQWSIFWLSESIVDGDPDDIRMSFQGHLNEVTVSMQTTMSRTKPLKNNYVHITS